MRRTTRRILLGSRFDPRKIPGLVAWYDPNDSAFVTLNGPGISRLGDKAWRPGDSNRDLLQATANNQPLISRADNAGNLLVWSGNLNTTWVKSSSGTGSNPIVTEGYADGPTGIPGDGTRIQFDAGAGGSSADLSQLSQTMVLNPETTKGSLWIKTADGSSKTLRFSFNGTTEAAVTSNWQRFTITRGYTGTGAQLRIGLTGNRSATADIVVAYPSSVPASWDSTYIATVATPAIAGLNGYRQAYFNGSSHSLEASGFTRPQPHTVIQIVKPWTWTSGDDLFADAALDGAVMQQTGSSPQIKMYSGSFGPVVSPALGAHAFLAAVFNGADSLCYLNGNAPTTGNVGSDIASGFCLGARGNQASGWAHIQSGPVLLYNRALNDNEIAYLRDWAKRLYRLNY